MTIHLHNLEFFAYHGLHAEETQTGGKFLVNTDVTFTHADKIDELSATIDYTAVFLIIQSFMKKKYQLLETLAIDITQKIYELDNRIKKINISIYKINVPVTNFSGNVGVTYSKEY